jgi:hypothetical protein
MQTGSSNLKQADHEQEINRLQSRPVKLVAQGQTKGSREQDAQDQKHKETQNSRPNFVRVR